MDRNTHPVDLLLQYLPLPRQNPFPFTWLFVLFATLLIGVTVTAFSSVTGALNTELMPLRVVPPDGVSSHTESITLSTSSPSSVDRLYVKAHQISYHVGGNDTGEWEGFDVEGAASIRINNGPWIDVRDENVTCAFPESEYGCIGGAPATVRFSMPVTGVTNTNTIEFRFNGTKGVRSGYRVLEVGFMSGSHDIQTFDASRDGLQDGTTFAYDDPAMWSAPSGYDNSTDIAAGKNLFTSRNILEDRIMGAPEPITAACSDCHALDGMDLKYFAYSNQSIVSRSRFHGLTNEQGRQIAAYIRSITLRHEDGTVYEAPGTPWDPPFQPGHTSLGSGEKLTDTNADLWSAGAGLDDVLNRDEEMVRYMFPRNGNPANGADTFNDPATGETHLNWTHTRIDQGTLPAVDWPIALQFPDWNNWLPDVAPVDHPTFDFEGTTYFNGENAWSVYTFLVGNPRTGEYGGELAARDHSREQDRSWTADDFRKFGEFVRKARKDTGWGDAYLAKARLSIQQWGAVRLWEMHQNYHLFDKADDGFGKEYDDWSQPIGFWPRSRILFDMAPHILGGNEDPPHPYGTRLGSKYYTHAWYHMQTLLAPGVHPQFGGQGPVDWQYQAPHLRELAGITGVGAGMRQLQGELVRWERFYNENLRTGTGLSSGDTGFGRRWNPRHTTPLHWMGCPFGQSGQCTTLYRNLSSDTKRQVVTAALRSWWAAHSSIPLTEYQSWQCSDEQVCWEPDTHTPSPDSHVYGHVYADRYYQEIPRMRDGGVAAGMLDSLATWTAQMWPRGDDPDIMGSNPTWSELIDYSPPTSSSQAINLQQGWNIISSAVVPDDASMEAVFSSLGSSLVLVKNETGESYIPEFTVNTIGSWRSDEAYKVFVTANEQISMDGVETDPTSAISLQEGWNLVAFWPSSSMAAEDAFSSLGSNLMIVKDAAGNAYIPGESINTLDNGTGQVHPGQGYQVYVSSAADLVYPTSSQTLASISGGESKAQDAARGVASSASIVVDAPGLDDGTTMIAETRDGARVGTGTARDGKVLVRVWGADPQNPSAGGASSGDALTLRVPSRNEGEAVAVAQTRNLISGATATDLTFAPDALLATTADLANLELSLRDNYPNPVQSSTNIEFVLPAQQRVEIEVYDLLGRRVSTVMDEAMPAGVHKVSFDASRLSSGTYFYRMRTSGQTFSRKMVVVR